MNTAHFFESYFKKAKVNCFLIMDRLGRIIDISSSFTRNFHYTLDDVKGESFSMLFTERDKREKVPEKELNIIHTQGQARDENYVVDKYGNAVWCTGESILVDTPEGEPYIVKDIINLE